ncbi:MAG: 50S ribosomal protein L24 [Deltaproteobacteria bacterium]|nr:50S ribosomal protein L24 [Deltaproteobacteria bacterium]
MKVKKGDQVQVIAGKDRGKRGKVLKVVKGDRVLVEKLNIMKKHARTTEKEPRGGIVDKEAPIHVSNVMVVSVRAGNRPVRVNYKVIERSGKTQKVRHSHKMNESID